MRIIAGVARGRRLRSPDTKETRPVTDRVREAVFSSLGSLVEGADVADLYAGTGSFGLEALSRGAHSALFVESGHRALEVLKANIASVALGGKVVRARVWDFLGRCTESFDLVFMDPPWDQPTTTMEEELARLDPHLRPGAVVVVSRRHSDPVPRAPETWRVAAEKRYGDTRIIRYEKAGDT
ncbi:MAG: 16S rRNA (guanine(966)-N(2))-methyltransferase RsmD [Acidimicrobiia bacterium]